MMQFSTYIWITVLIIVLALYFWKKVILKQDSVTGSYKETRLFTIDVNYMQSKIKYALEAACFKEIAHDSKNAVYQALTKPNIFSWGEKITVNYNIHEGNQVTILFKSNCLVGFQMFDWGKNKRNAKLFYNYLNKTEKT